MTKTYTVELTDTEDKALSSVCNQAEWITNAATARASAAIDSVVAVNMAKCNEDGIAIATGVEAQVAQAFERGYVTDGS